MENTNDVKSIYQLRENFSVVGLTGKIGSGCTKFSELITSTEQSKPKYLRKPSEIRIFEKKENLNDIYYEKRLDLDEELDNNVIFKRKYKICYDFFKKNHKTYETISYIDVILFYVVCYSVNEKDVRDSSKLFILLTALLKENFKDFNEDKEGSIISKSMLTEYFNDEKTELNNLISEIKKYFDEKSDSIDNILKEIRSGSDLNKLNDWYFGECFQQFSKKFYKYISCNDYYYASTFVNRLGNKIRGNGNPFIDNKELKNHLSTENVFNLAHLINRLIKAYKLTNKDKSKGCHICIDSLRNSLEIMFFKERYSAFYMIAIHNEDRHYDRIKKRIENLVNNNNSSCDAELIAKKVISLDKIEYKNSDFKKGIFYQPDVEECIQKSDIHINNPGIEFEEEGNPRRDTCFYSLREQWLKVHSLILHPGIITPSSEERGMLIAYNAKLNSGCISRQVGAAVLDRYGSLKSIGWNEVPNGSIPCLYRNVSELIRSDGYINEDKTYSNFEFNDDAKKYDNKDISYSYDKNFSKNMKGLFGVAKIDVVTKLGLNYPFCFKSFHNSFEGKDNQIHTRTLHAEENAMLQVAKFGGQSIKGGTLFTTASPCELCSKKAYQMGFKNIIYIDPYPGISKEHVLANGYGDRNFKLFSGIIGRSFNKLYESFMPYKDELAILSPDEYKSYDKVKRIKELCKDLNASEKEDIIASLK